ncbi:MAG: NAD-dependent epimerase/dehydratase family protein [Acidimicrobiales bacterium]
MPRALILGGTGASGVAIALRLRVRGWGVTVTSRDPARVPPPLALAGVRHVVGDRGDARHLASALGAGADLLVDAACYDAAHARAVTPLATDVASVVMISSKAVYVDDAGRHANSPEPPRFAGPILETQATLRPDARTLDAGASYGGAKVAAEEVLLACDAPVSVLRPSKVHGARSRRPREWIFVRRVLDGRDVVLLRDGGRGADHPSAAANVAALVETVARVPGTRILNAADPDCPTVRQIAQSVAAALGHAWRQVDVPAADESEVARAPWDHDPPVRLDTRAAGTLGYQPVGDYATTGGEELDWLVTEASQPDGSGWLPGAGDPFFAPLLDYASEDARLAR